jgi:hypothetical protein
MQPPTRPMPHQASSRLSPPAGRGALQLLEALTLLGGQARPRALVTISLADPVPEGLHVSANLLGDRGDRHCDPCRGLVQDHPHRSRPYLQREPTRSWHDPILSRYGDSGKSLRGSNQAAPSTRGGPGISARRAAVNDRNTAWARALFAAVQPLVFPGGIREPTRCVVNRVDVLDLLARWAQSQEDRR